MRYLVKTKANGLNLWDEMDRAFDTLWNNQGSPASKPAVDVYEKEDAYFFVVDLPGYAEEEVSVEVKDNLLTLKAEQKSEEEERSYLIKERKTKKANRSFYVPKDVDQNNITASFQKGVLTLTMPKVPEAGPKQIKIN